MDTLQRTNKDMNIVFNITDILAQCLRWHQIYPYALTILAYLRYCPSCMRKVTTDEMDYVDAATTNILSPDILPVEDIRTMLRDMTL